MSSGRSSTRWFDVKNPMTAAAVHKQYEETVLAFRRQMTEPAMRALFTAQIDDFMRRCAAGLWQTDGGLTPLHVEYYNAVYTKGNPVPTTLYWDLCTRVANYGGFEIPDFFHRMVRCDLERGTGLSRRFADTFTLLLLLLAAVDGVVSEDEAGFVNSCADALTACCDVHGVVGGRTGADAKEFVTRRTDGTVVQKGSDSTEPAAAAAEPEQPEEAAQPEQTLEELLAELDGLCGLDKVKQDVKSLINLV